VIENKKEKISHLHPQFPIPSPMGMGEGKGMEWKKR